MDETTLLRLLLDEAPAAEFEREVQRTRARDDDPDAQEAAYLAMQLRLELRERRRRESELAALFATAGDLIAIRDPERVLRAIVRRARQLLEADTAYLTLIDEERGDTFMRVTEGTLTPEFDQVRLPLGVGLGGLVAATGMPSWTADYLDDDRFAHADDIDVAVRDEGIRAIVGAPLILGDEVIGVLFASNRHARPFGADQVNLLASLAAHAAIAIENARLFDELTRTLEELSRTNAVVRAHSEAVERAAATHERLTSIVLQGGTLDDVVSAVSEVLESSVALLDPAGRPLAEWVTVDEADPPNPGALAAAVADVLRDGTQHTGPAGVWMTPVGAGGGHFGVLALRATPELSDVDLRTFERAAQVTALVLLSQRAIVDADFRQRGELLDDLLAASHRDLEVVRLRARRLGVSLDTPHMLVVVSSPSAERGALRSAVADVVERCSGLAAERSAAMIMLLPATSSPTAAEVADELAAALAAPVTAGTADVDRIDGVRDAYHDADRCRRTLQALGREGEIASPSDLGVFSLLFNQVDNADLGRFVEQAIGPVLAYDDARGTELVPTLEAYFAAAGNVTQAAAALHVHVNTLYQRCERISSLLTPRWQDPQEALRIQLALQVHRVRTRT